LLVDPTGGMRIDFPSGDAPLLLVGCCADGLFGLMTTFANCHQAIQSLDIKVAQASVFAHLIIPFSIVPVLVVVLIKGQ
jgi:uncharacterized membrane protein YdjX (TVP38/TMEM64 family)